MQENPEEKTRVPTDKKEFAVRLSGLTKRFGKITAIENITIDVPQGSFLTLLGPSGSGKTTVLRCIAGVEEPDAGTIEISGKVVFSASARVSLPSEKRNVGMVYQSYALWPHMKVYENVAYPLRVRRTSKSEIEKMVSEVLDELGISEVSGRYPSMISGGQQQRVALARALVYRPSVLLLDEPLSNLDEQLRQSVRDDLKQLQRKIGISTIYVTHDTTEALSLSDKIVLLNKGKVDSEGDPQTMLMHPSTGFTAKFVGGMLVLDGVVDKILKEAESAVVQTNLGKILCDTDGQATVAGGEVKLCIRPGELSIAAENDSENVLLGIVKGITLAADRKGVRVSFGDQTVLIPMPRMDSRNPSVGDAIRVKVPPAACYIIVARSATNN